MPWFNVVLLLPYEWFYLRIMFHIEIDPCYMMTTTIRDGRTSAPRIQLFRPIRIRDAIVFDSRQNHKLRRIVRPLKYFTKPLVDYDI